VKLHVWSECVWLCVCHVHCFCLLHGQQTLYATNTWRLEERISFFFLFILSLYFASNLIMRSFTLYSILCRCVHLKLKCANVSIESVTPVSVSGVIWLSGGILIAQQNSDSVFRESTSTFIVSAWQAVIGESILPSKKVRLQV